MASQQHQPPPNPQSVLQQQQQAQQQLNQQQDFDPVHRFKMLIPQLKESLQNVMSIASQNFVHNSGIDNGILMSGPATFIGYSVTFSKALCENSLLAGVKKQLMTATCPDEMSKSYAALNIKSMSVLRFRTVRAENPLSPRKNSDTTVQRFDKSLEEFYALCDQLELCLRLAHECLSQSIDSAKHSPNLVPTATKPETVQNEALSYSQYLSMIKSQISCAKDIHNALLECSKKIAGKGQPQGIL